MKITVNVSKEYQQAIDEIKRITDGQVNMQEVYDTAFSMGIDYFVNSIIEADESSDD